MYLTMHLSVADNARDAVLLHVSASSEGQEWGNKTGSMTKRAKHQILANSEVCVPIVLLVPLNIAAVMYYVYVKHFTNISTSNALILL